MMKSRCYECDRSADGPCWRHGNGAAVVVPPYTFRPFEPIDSTYRPVVISPEGISVGVAPAGTLQGLSWAPPPAVRRGS